MSPALDLCRLTATSEAAARKVLAAELPGLARTQAEALPDDLERVAVGAILARVDWEAVADRVAERLHPRMVSRIGRQVRRQRRREL